MRSFLASDGVVQYQLDFAGELASLNSLVGQTLQLRSLEKIQCVACDRVTKKSFADGYCYPCFRSLPQCDLCIVRPETCHFVHGTCRDAEWGQTNCMVEHSVYISNSSGPKVGITRRHQRMTRWIDQGAIQAIELCITPTRKDAGLIEVELAKLMKDKTNWRKMLMGEPEALNLEEMRAELAKSIPQDIAHLYPSESKPYQLVYPIIGRPAKIASLSLEDPTKPIESRLLGIKAQSLIFEAGVINIRKYQGYSVALSTEVIPTQPIVSLPNAPENNLP